MDSKDNRNIALVGARSLAVRSRAGVLYNLIYRTYKTSSEGYYG
jgi:hypothetical protein